MRNTAAYGRRLIADFERLDDALKALDGEHHIEIWYLGTIYERRVTLENRQSERIVFSDFTKSLDKLADELETDLLRLDEHLGVAEEGRQAWDASILSDLSPYVGDLQLNLCRFVGVARRLKEGDGSVLFIVDEARLGHALVKGARDNGLDVGWCGRPVPTLSFWRKIRAKLSALRITLQHKRAMKRARKPSPAPWDALRECDILVFDWSERNSFPNDAPVRETRNLRRISASLQDAGLRIGYVAMPISWTQPVQDIADNIAQAFDPVVMVDELRTMSSVLKGMWRSWRLTSVTRGCPILKTLDCSAIIDITREQDQLTPQSAIAYSFSDIASIMAKLGIQPKAIVYPYENQGWERCLRLGVRSNLPKTRMIAYQFAPFAPRYLSFYPFRSDIESDRLPDCLICIGEYYRGLMAQHGFPEERLKIGGTMSFGGMGNEALATHAEQPIARTVLCSTSIKYSESLDLACKCVRALEDVSGVRLIINYHPVVDETFRRNLHDQVELLCKGHNGSIEFSVEPSRTLIARADLMAFNTSGAAFDALVAGKPVVYVPVEGEISYNKVPFGLAEEAGGERALKDTVLNMLYAPEISNEGGRSSKDIGNVLGQYSPNVFVESVNS